MRIAIDCHSLGTSVGGNETYTFCLTSALIQLDRRNEYVLFYTRASDKVAALAAADNATAVRVRPHWPYMRIPVSLPQAVRNQRVDVLHVQYITPPFVRAPVVNMIHDVASLYYPQFFSRSEYFRNRLLLPQSVHAAARILTVSQASKDQIVRAFGIPPSKVVVTYNGISERFRRAPAHQVGEVLEKYRIAGPYLLFVGNIQPRKNLQGIVEAFVIMKQQHALRHRLVVVGRKAWLYSDIFERVRQLKLQDDITFTGYVPDDDLPALYTGADLLMYPSFFEGFGFPPLEAMACGTPAVAAQEPAFPEILGDAAVLVDPRSPTAIAQGALRILSDGAFCRELVARGLERAARFTWEAAARVTLAVFEEVTTDY